MPFNCDAVHFDGSSYLRTASLTSADSDGYFAASVWFKYNEGWGNVPLWIADPSQYVNLGNIDEGAPGQLSIQFGLADSSATNFIEMFTDDTTTDVWHHLLVAAKMTETAGNKIIKAFIDDADVSNAFSDATGSWVPGFNGLEFLIGGDTFGNNFAGDLFDVWIAPNVNLLTAGTISEATRRKFITAGGCPVDLGANGETPTGSSPVVFFHGSASAFATNLGTGGAFTLTGSLTDAVGPCCTGATWVPQIRMF